MTAIALHRGTPSISAWSRTQIDDLRTGSTASAPIHTVADTDIRRRGVIITPITEERGIAEMKSCMTCRWAKMGWIDRYLFKDGANALCVHPKVLSGALNAARQGWLLPSFMGGGPVFPADPVTGEPQRVEFPCSLARAQQYARGSTKYPALTPAPLEERADANCGPEGRYWTRR